MLQFLLLCWLDGGAKLTVSDVRATSLAEVFVLAGKELGYAPVDLDGSNPEGLCTFKLKFLCWF